MHTRIAVEPSPRDRYFESKHLAVCFLLLLKHFPPGESQGESNIMLKENATMARVPLDYLDFILLSVRNQTESCSPKPKYAVRF